MKNRPWNPKQKEYLKQHDSCELCGMKGTLEVHHILPLAVGGRDVQRNWIAICPACHRKLTPASELCSVAKRKISSMNRFWINLFTDIEESGEIWETLYRIEEKCLSKVSLDYKEEAK